MPLQAHQAQPCWGRSLSDPHKMLHSSLSRCLGSGAQTVPARHQQDILLSVRPYICMPSLVWSCTVKRDVPSHMDSCAREMHTGMLIRNKLLRYHPRRSSRHLNRSRQCTDCWTGVTCASQCASQLDRYHYRFLYYCFILSLNFDPPNLPLQPLLPNPFSL